MSLNREAQDLFNVMRLLAGQQQPTVSLDGVIAPNSYDPTTGTVTVVLGDTAGITADVDPDDENPVTVQHVPLSVPAYGFQHGPLGGERVTLIAAQGGSFRAVLDYESDDSPNAPAGETWSVKFARGLSDLTVQAFWKLTNDGQNVGDGMGGFRAGAPDSYASLVGKLVEAGAEGLDPEQQASLRWKDLLAYHNWLFGTALMQWAAANVQPGSGALGPTGTPPAQGSQTVRAAD